MAEKTKNTERGRVELLIPRLEVRGEETVYIGINGKGYLIPRGKKTMVPPEVKEEYERKLVALEHLQETKARELEKAKTGQ